MNDDQLLHASAYLDGDVDATERARAEADPEVMLEVDRLRAVRSALRDVEAPDPGRREQALAAALAAFGDEAAPAAVPPPPPAVPLARRQPRSWWGGVLAAAAALVVVVGGVVVLRGAGGGGGDDDSASIATARDELTLSEESASSDAGAAAPAAPRDGADNESQEAPAATESAEDTATGGPSAAGSLAAGSVPELSGPDELVAFATSAARSSAPVVDTSSCPQPGTFVGPATYAGTPVEVYVDDTTVTAVDATSCVVVEQVER